ncbi:conserved protein of unknown function [Cupriavidus taiwanensis]|nr:protein of unknown function [Cupriavidus taiwanensis]SOZ03427.1 hypothetical protein CBM2597_A130076 [Cupriavidus taiwanensis]SOZ08986.1 hypothetical protein CBM2595_A90076 [Cupriavidus taiwanensis]SPD41934.1 conserved protein of unknown function [Cupriavidus taiwanensis]
MRERGGGEGRSLQLRCSIKSHRRNGSQPYIPPRFCTRLPSPPTPLPHAGEGSKQADHDQRIHPMTTPALTQPKGNP